MHPLFEHHKNEYGTPAEIMASAPGRVSIFGEYTEAADGCMLQMALKKRVSVSVSKRDDNSLRFFSADLGERKKTSISNLKYKREDRWANYPKGVIHSLLGMGHPLRGMDISIAGEIPQGIGLGSSSALCVATAMAIREIFQLELSDFQLLDAARQAEARFLDIKIGFGQSILSMKAHQGSLMYADLRDLDFKNIPLEKQEDILFVLTDSKVPQNSFEAEAIDYSDEIKSCVAALSKRKGGSSLRDFSREDIREAVGWMEEDARRRCLHLVQEMERVNEAVELVQKGRWETLGKMMNRSHEGLRDLYEASCPEVDWLVKRAWETTGVYGSKMTGEGFGGCTLSLMERSALDEYKKHLDEYDRIFGFTPECTILEPADGATIIKP